MVHQRPPSARSGGLAPLSSSRAANQQRVVSVRSVASGLENKENRSSSPHYVKKATSDVHAPTVRPMSVVTVEPPIEHRPKTLSRPLSKMRLKIAGDEKQKRPSIPFAKISPTSSIPLPSIAPIARVRTDDGRRRTQFIVREDAPEVPPKDTSDAGYAPLDSSAPVDTNYTSTEDNSEVLVDEPKFGDNFSPTPAFAYAGDAEQTFEPASETSIVAEPKKEEPVDDDIFSVSPHPFIANDFALNPPSDLGSCAFRPV